MHKKITMAILALMSSGCATVGSYQAKCEQQHAAFSEMIQCLKASVATDPRPSMAKDPRVKLYLLKAEQLNQKVENREINELDAKVILQELYVHLKRDEDADVDSMIANTPRTTHTNCTSYGSQVNCTSR